MNLRDLLQEFGQQTGLGDVPLNEDNTCRMIFDGDLVVDIEATEDGAAYLHCVADVVPVDDRESYYRAILEANFFGAGTSGSSFAIDPSTDEVVLCLRLELENMDYPTFLQALEGMVNRLAQWRERLNPTALHEAEESVESGIDGPALRESEDPDLAEHVAQNESDSLAATLAKQRVSVIWG